MRTNRLPNVSDSVATSRTTPYPRSIPYPLLDLWILPHLVDRRNTCENITFPTTSFAGGNKQKVNMIPVMTPFLCNFLRAFFFLYNHMLNTQSANHSVPPIVPISVAINHGSFTKPCIKPRVAPSPVTKIIAFSGYTFPKDSSVFCI